MRSRSCSAVRRDWRRSPDPYSGGTTAVGVLYRSDALHALTPAGEAESPCKDHTGVCAAVLLDAVGVTRDAIIAGVRPAAQSARSDLDVDD